MVAPSQEESDETNNIYEKKFLLPDLQILSIDREDSIIQTGQPIDWKILVKNNGSGSAPQSYLAFDDDASTNFSPISNIAVPRLNPGQIHEVTFSRNPKVGESYWIEIDAKNRVSESNENNNVEQAC